MMLMQLFIYMQQVQGALCKLNSYVNIIASLRISLKAVYDLFNNGFMSNGCLISQMENLFVVSKQNGGGLLVVLDSIVDQD